MCPPPVYMGIAARSRSAMPDAVPAFIESIMQLRDLPLVLVVDDEPGIIEFLRFALEDNGYRVATARDGSEALREIGRERPDFVVTDLMMPRLDGWELCRTLRHQDATRSMPIVGMSAIEPHGALLDAFLRKPFELDELLGTLKEMAPASQAAADDVGIFQRRTR